MPYLGKTPSQATRQRYYKTASAGDTSVSGTMTTGGTLTFTDGEFVDVSVNGVALVAGTDYNTSTANTIAGLSALSAGDQVEIVVYDTFSVFSGDVDSNMSVGGNLSVTGTATLTGNADFNGDLDVDGTTNLDVVDIDGAVDMASTLQVDGAITSSAGATITTADNTVQLTLKSTDADANNGPILDLIRDSASPADGDEVGVIRFKFDDDAGEVNTAARFTAKINDASNGTEDGELEIVTLINGSSRSRIEMLPTETVINEDSVDVDFRVESNGDANLLKVDAGNDVLGIGAASPDTTFRTSIHGDGSSIVGGILFRNNPSGGETFTIGHANATSTSGKINVVGAGNLVFATNNTERMRIDSSGNLQVGTNTYDGSHFNDTSGGGFAVTSAGKIDMKVDGTVANLNMTNSSDGNLLFFAKEGVEVGKINTLSSAGAIGIFGAGGSGAGLVFQNNDIIQPGVGGVRHDDSQDLGSSSFRFDNIFATNGTIQTSDENEKQNITSLTSAEITAAKAISKLFKTFKWKSKVTAKGDAARTHTGVIAQEVQAAMSAAGLDATKYAFWCSDTWWEKSTDVAAVEAVEEKLDELGNLITMAVEAKDAYTRIDTYHTESEAPEGATKRTRLGVRYPELMAFVLSSIEDRITALENAQ